MRPTKDEYYFEIAKQVAQRSTCLRAIAGAIIVNNDAIVSTGYSGSARGEKNCCDVGICERDRLGILPGQNYEKCLSVHAEANTIINAARNGQLVLGGKMYLYFERLDNIEKYHGGTCEMCQRMLINSGIIMMVTKEIVYGVPKYFISEFNKEVNTK